MAPYLTLLPEDAGHRAHGLREVSNGLRYVVKTGAPWRWMPNDLPPWSCVYQRAQRWLATGCFEALVDDLRAVLRLAAGRAADAAMIAKRLDRPLRREGGDILARILADAVGTPLANFTAGLGRDRAAVQDALDTPWSTNPAEGQINRVKAIKRSMCGRVGFPLLRARVLHAA